MKDLKKRCLFALSPLAIFALMYGMTNHLHAREPFLLTPSAIDGLVPFQPSWIWVYLATYPYAIAWGFSAFHPTVNGIRAIRGFLGLVFVSGVCFALFPTALPRLSEVSITEGRPYLETLAFQILHTLDTPSNCIPSFHVGLCTYSAFVLDQKRLRLSPTRALFGLLVIYSTLATKQHFAWDVISGMAFGAAAALATYFAPLPTGLQSLIRSEVR